MPCEENRANQLEELTEREFRCEQLNLPHMAPLKKYVEYIRLKRGCAVPYFDPCDGGIEAEVLFLFEAAGPKAIETNFISRNNPDRTANNTLELLKAARIPREKTALWNIIPWKLEDGNKIEDEIEKAKIYLDELLTLLDGLKAIVLVGKAAQQAADHIGQLSNLPLYLSNHPSPQNIITRPYMWPKILGVFCEVSEYLLTLNP